MASLVPDLVPAGLDLAAAIDLPLANAERRRTSLRLYGAGTPEDPVAQADLAVYASPIDDDASVDDTEGRPVLVRGRNGRSVDPYGPASWKLRAVRWRENRQFLQLVSRSLSVDDLVEIAEALEVSTDSVALGKEAPGGLTLVADQDDAAVPSVGSVPVPSSSSGHVISYTSPDGDAGIQRHFVIGTHRGDASDLAVLRWFFGPATEPVSVAGQPGVLARLAGASRQSVQACGPPPCKPSAPVETDVGAFVLAWLRPGGALVAVSAQGLEESVVMESAASIRPADDREWADLGAAAARRQEQRGGR